MSDDTRISGWQVIIGSVKTPLGFFTLISLILDAILLGGSVLTDKLPMWMPISILGLLVVCVFVIMYKKPMALYPPEYWETKKRMNVKLLFHPRNLEEPMEAIDVDLNVIECELKVRDEQNQARSMPVPKLTLGHGGWTFQLPEDVVDTDSIRLELIEHNSKKWKVISFPPYETNVRAMLNTQNLEE